MPKIIFDNYEVYPDGKVISLFYNRMLKVTNYRRRPNDRIQKVVRLQVDGKEMKTTVARLVYFLYCKHKHKKLDSLGPVTYKGKSRKIHPDNLVESTKGGVLKKYKIRPKSNRGNNAKIPPEAKEYIESILYLGTKTAILKRLANSKFQITTTSMSLLRFMRRHNIDYEGARHRFQVIA